MQRSADNVKDLNDRDRELDMQDQLNWIYRAEQEWRVAINNSEDFTVILLGKGETFCTC